MSEKLISKVEKTDIVIGPLARGETAIVLQRHEKYNRDHDAENAGSINLDAADATYNRDLQQFEELLADGEGAERTFVLFVSSDTQYAGKGRRSLETGQLAQDAARQAMQEAGVNPGSHILNINDAFDIDKSKETGQDIRVMRGLIEPQIFETEESRRYVDYLREKYGTENGPGNGISPDAWAAHETDAEKEVREAHGAEGVRDILDRTKHSLAVLERYARIFHANNPDARLVIWATSHYDTISPFVKDSTEVGFDEYIPVDYGAGVVLHVPAEPNGETELRAQGHLVAVKLGKNAIRS